MRKSIKIWVIPAALVLCTVFLMWFSLFDRAGVLLGALALLQEPPQSQHGLLIEEPEPPQEEPLPTEIQTTAEATYPAYGQEIGSIEIKSADILAPVIQGDSDEILDVAAGHGFAYALPGEGGKVVVSAHRNTLFETLGEVSPGDEIIFHTYWGDYTYEMQEYLIFDMDDPSYLLSEEEGETLVLYTCYPFDYIGSAVERYAIICTPKEGSEVTWV